MKYCPLARNSCVVYAAPLNSIRGVHEQVFCGSSRSLARQITDALPTLHHRLHKVPPMNGITVDLGGGGRPTYLDILKINGSFFNLDRVEEAKPSLVGDLEQPFPLATESINNTILFSTLEHIFGYQHVVDEMARILKTGGSAVVCVPFIFPFHTHETEAFLINDYFRYSASALDRIFRSAGFKDVIVEPMGGVGLVIAEFMGYIVRFRFLRFLLAIFGLTLQATIETFRPNTSATRYPLAYFVTAVK